MNQLLGFGKYHSYLDELSSEEQELCKSLRLLMRPRADVEERENKMDELREKIFDCRSEFFPYII